MSENVVIKQGFLRKKKAKANTWGERYFILRNNVLEYYVKQSDSVRILQVADTNCV